MFQIKSSEITLLWLIIIIETSFICKRHIKKLWKESVFKLFFIPTLKHVRLLDVPEQASNRGLNKMRTYL